MNNDELKIILEKHLLWLKGNPDGRRAELKGIDLRGCDLRGSNLSRCDLGAFRTEMILRMYAYGKKNISFPSLESISKCRKTTKRTIQRHINELIKNGRITKKMIKK
jgi:hypothetical protein